MDENTVLVVRYCGPRGYPGMPEVSNVALPKKLLLRGVRDIVRICDGRMSAPPTAPWSCTSPRRPRRAGRWPWCGPATGSRWTCRHGRSRWRCPRMRWRSGGPSGSRGAAREPRLDPAVHRARAAGRLRADLDFLVGASGHEVPRDSHSSSAQRLTLCGAGNKNSGERLLLDEAGCVRGAGRRRGAPRTDAAAPGVLRLPVQRGRGVPASPGGPTASAPGPGCGPTPAAGTRCPASRCAAAGGGGSGRNSASRPPNSSWSCPGSATRRGWPRRAGKRGLPGLRGVLGRPAWTRPRGGVRDQVGDWTWFCEAVRTGQQPISPWCAMQVAELAMLDPRRFTGFPPTRLTGPRPRRHEVIHRTPKRFPSFTRRYPHTVHRAVHSLVDKSATVFCVCGPDPWRAAPARRRARPREPCPPPSSPAAHADEVADARVGVGDDLGS